MKLLAAILLTASLVTGTVRADAPQAVVTTNPRPILDSEVVRLGDIFTNLGDKADMPVTYAPRHGERLVLEVAWLARLARTHHISWRPRSRYDRVTVIRASRTVERSAIVAYVKAALRVQGASRNLRIRLDRRGAALHVAPNAPADVALRDLRYDRDTGRFVVTVLAPAEAPTVQTVVSGRAVGVAKIPVLARRIAKNQIIADSDVEWISVTTDRIQQGTVTDLDRLVGLTPRHSLDAGKPIRSHDLRRPIIVPKGSLVTAILQLRHMTLTVRAKALDNGASGDTIRVMNTKSRRTFEGVVTGPDMVAIKPLHRLAKN